MSKPTVFNDSRRTAAPNERHANAAYEANIRRTRRWLNILLQGIKATGCRPTVVDNPRFGHKEYGAQAAACIPELTRITKRLRRRFQNEDFAAMKNAKENILRSIYGSSSMVLTVIIISLS